jgi:hypothetical protein
MAQQRKRSPQRGREVTGLGNTAAAWALVIVPVAFIGFGR